MSGPRHAPAALYTRERPGTHCTGGWVGLRAGLDRCGKSGLHRDSISGPYIPWRGAIPTELSRPTRAKSAVIHITILAIWKVLTTSGTLVTTHSSWCNNHSASSSPQSAAILSLPSTNRLVLTVEMDCAFCEVGTKLLCNV